MLLTRRRAYRFAVALGFEGERVKGAVPDHWHVLSWDLPKTKNIMIDEHDMIPGSLDSVAGTVQRVELPWGAWHQDERHCLELPERWSVDVLAPRDASAWSMQEISAAIRSPIECRTLRELADGCKRVCIVVDDLARPTQASDMLPPVLGELHDAGVPKHAVTIVVATGSHGRLGEQQLGWKVGAATVSNYRVECHDCRGDLAATGILYGKRDLRINRSFFEADLNIAIGSVLPHSFAGYSGGAKLVLPGLSDLEAAARSHKFVQMGLRGGYDPDRNRFRREIEDLARRLGLHYVVCTVPSTKRETAGVFAGDVVAAHRAACKMAKEVYATPLRETYDCVILNAYPKDIDLVQAETVWTGLKTAQAPLVGDGGVYVITTAASHGLGCHGLFGPGGVSYREPRANPRLKNRDLWLYSPGVDEQEVRKLYWQGCAFFRDATTLANALARRLPEDAKVGVLPCAPMQRVDDRREPRDRAND